jgi:glycosyltransferase involved in cell wall biosynthesis
VNVLLFIHSLSSGGAERVTVGLANYWSQIGWTVTIVTLADASDDFYPLAAKIRRISLNLAEDSRNLGSALRMNSRRVASLRRVLKETKPQIALAMMSSANVTLALASIGLRDLATVGAERVHPPQFPIGRVWSILRACSYSLLTAVVSQTEKSAAWLATHTGARQIDVIPNAAIWPLTSHPPQLQPPAKAAGQRILLAVGRLTRQKGFDLLISAFCLIAKEFPEWRLVILGEGPDRHKLEMQVEAEGMDQRIGIPGRAGNMSEWYQYADLFALSSRFEGFPNTLLEAMSHGMPVVSFDCDTGPREIIRNGTDGLLAATGSVDHLSEKLRLLMGDDQLRSRLSLRAPEVRERYSYEAIHQRWLQLFERVRKNP